MTKQEQILLSIEAASKRIGTTWPLYSFVTSNPLSGYEKLPFEDAVQEAGRFLKSNSYPSASIYKQAFENNDIDKTVLSEMLKEAQLLKSPEAYLQEMERLETTPLQKPASKLDVIMAKWLAVFMDEGMAEWQIPNKEKGFYNAWKALAVYDKDIGKPSLKHLPKTSIEALEQVLSAHSIINYNELFSAHIAALSGWTGYIKHRIDTNSVWQQQFPITIEDYLAVRLTIANHLNMPLEIVVETSQNDLEVKLKHLWLKAWEATFQNRLVSDLKTNNIRFDVSKEKTELPDAQMVFCIDTRSEMIRRHVEASGNYETYGYAGFFGIAADYQHYQEDISIKSCPPIVGSPYKITETPNLELAQKDANFKSEKRMSKAKTHILKRLKNMLPSSFGFVEGAGAFYGLSLIAQSFIPSSYFKIKNRNKRDYESFCEPRIAYNDKNKTSEDIALQEKVAIVKSGFDLMGWERFAPLVIFAGHGSHTANNPFGSSLDCGACAASPGRHNARLLATLANDNAVRAELKSSHQIDIPTDTVFVGAEHNTTTDEIVLFDAHIPETHLERLSMLKKNLRKVQETATSERLNVTSGSVELAKKKSLNWGETRPEWGLAKNAAFIVGSRDLTSTMHLDGRCFMHSYNWELDPEGKALEGIMGGPMVVTQWINNHYYFSTVDNNRFGGGSKITHNITGQFGVVQGNGGDLKMGLPLQSLKASDTEMYHQPLRLTTMIHAPLGRVELILRKNKHLQTLLDNEWMYLKVIDTNDSNRFKSYNKNYNWSLEEVSFSNVKTEDKRTLVLSDY
ncbi:hypothetical protein SAMN04515667_0347 [Formosa sp. Hel1_31_208]|uniref:DUF2309 domain-containing protein n=1 Tax=Formosa sp. Hel1_31_208 TaxID=1798225 RepID=UPI00087A37BE|nr:DUF2309 domain-containing protein [Formosa sp. Hel1_31_208]SDR69815.1 hypothetical protein SAMN04515667_0347 [Formosa sp. Hel1_31_208]